MVYNKEDRSYNKKLIEGEQQEAWNSLTLKHDLEVVPSVMILTN